jgi:hypothetical protein
MNKPGSSSDPSINGHLHYPNDFDSDVVVHVEQYSEFTTQLHVYLCSEVRDSVWGTVIVVRHRLFNRHLNVPWGQTGLIHLQTLFQLQVGVSVHETLDKLLTDPVSPD